EGIFTMFQQLPNNDEISGESIGRHDGLGIGLALARAVVGMHGGTIRAESDGVGRGSQFVLRLPLSEIDEEESTTVQEIEEAQRWRVLVVDDNRDSAESLASLLRLDGHEVTVAFGGREALSVAEAAAPDLVLLDIGMPDLDGCEVARMLRASESTAAACIV